MLNAMGCPDLSQFEMVQSDILFGCRPAQRRCAEITGRRDHIREWRPTR